jgi:hypothetical protein
VVTVVGGTFDTAQPTLTGTVFDLSGDLTVTISDINGVVETGLATVTGNDWVYTVVNALTNGDYTVTVSGVDALGNPSTGGDASLTVAVIPDDPDTTEEDETDVQTVVTPIIVTPATPDVQGATDDNDEDTQGAISETPAAIDTDATDGTILGLAWYWWLLIVAAIAAGAWWLIAALRRRGNEA